MHSSVGFRMTSTSPVLWNKSHLYSHHIQQAWQNLKRILILFSSNLSISNLCVNFINIAQNAFLTLENNRHKVLTILCYLSKKKKKMVKLSFWSTAHYDPGPHWLWSSFLNDLVGVFCRDARMQSILCGEHRALIQAWAAGGARGGLPAGIPEYWLFLLSKKKIHYRAVIDINLTGYTIGDCHYKNNLLPALKFLKDYISLNFNLSFFLLSLEKRRSFFDVKIQL